MTAGRDPDSLLELVDTFVSYTVERWVPNPQFSGDCVLFVTAPETMQPTLDELASALTAATEAAGCADRVRFRIEHTPY